MIRLGNYDFAGIVLEVSDLPGGCQQFRIGSVTMETDSAGAVVAVTGQPSSEPTLAPEAPAEPQRAKFPHGMFGNRGSRDVTDE